MELTKATQLIDKYFSLNDSELQNKGTNPFISREYAVKCAIICVNEILEEIPMYIGNLNPKWKFYNDVLHELIKINNNGN